MVENQRVKTERNRVDKQKSPKKKKREDVQNKKLIADLCEAIYKLLLKNMFHQKMYGCLPQFYCSMIMMT